MFAWAKPLSLTSLQLTSRKFASESGEFSRNHAEAECCFGEVHGSLITNSIDHKRCFNKLQDEHIVNSQIGLLGITGSRHFNDVALQTTCSFLQRM